MPFSLVNGSGKIRPDGTGTVGLNEPGKEPEIRFLIVRGDLVVEGRGRAAGGD